MKWLGRFLAFALAVMVGTAAVWVGALFIGSLHVPDLAEPVSWRDSEPTAAVSPSGITVAYTGLGADDDGEPYLKFVVHNGLYRPITYRAHSSNDPFASLRSNGEKLPVLGRCGTGIQTFFILPGRSAEFHVRPHEFLTLPQKNAHISAGFYLKPAFANDYDLYFSEPFSLPEEFRKSIRTRTE